MYRYVSGASEGNVTCVASALLWLVESDRVTRSMQSAEGTGDCGGPGRLARWMKARQAERTRVAALAAAGVVDAAAYEAPSAHERLQLVRSSNALEPVAGLRQRAQEERRASGITLRTSVVAVALRRSSSMHSVQSSMSEEDVPIVAAWRARREEKRRRSLATSGRTLAAREDVASSAGAEDGASGVSSAAVAPGALQQLPNDGLDVDAAIEAKRAEAHRFCSWQE